MTSKRLRRTSVLVDPVMHARFLRLLGKRSFSAWIRRLERQTIEEAQRERPTGPV